MRPTAKRGRRTSDVPTLSLSLPDLRAHTRIHPTLSLSLPDLRAHTRILPTLSLSLPDLRARASAGGGNG